MSSDFPTQRVVWCKYVSLGLSVEQAAVLVRFTGDSPFLREAHAQVAHSLLNALSTYAKPDYSEEYAKAWIDTCNRVMSPNSPSLPIVLVRSDIFRDLTSVALGSEQARERVGACTLAVRGFNDTAGTAPQKVAVKAKLHLRGEVFDVYIHDAGDDPNGVAVNVGYPVVEALEARGFRMRCKELEEVINVDELEAVEPPPREFPFGEGKPFLPLLRDEDD